MTSSETAQRQAQGPGTEYPSYTFPHSYTGMVDRGVFIPKVIHPDAPVWTHIGFEDAIAYTERHIDVRQPVRWSWEDIAPTPQQQWLQRAKMMQELGFKVYPLTLGTKAPRGNRWVEKFTNKRTEMEQLAATVGDKWGMGLIPTTTIAYDLAAGYTREARRVILDADGKEGYDFLYKHLGAPDVVTASRSYGKIGGHWYIVIPEPIEGCSRAAGSNLKIDVFGADGTEDKQCVGAGSWINVRETSRGQYESVNAFYHDVHDHLMGDEEWREYCGSEEQWRESITYMLHRRNMLLPDAHPVMDWLRECAANHLAESAPKKVTGFASLVSAPSVGITPTAAGNATPTETPVMDNWSRSVEWEQLLPQLGCVREVQPAPCGCPAYRYHASTNPNSCVAHTEGCVSSRSAFAGGALHVYSETMKNTFGGRASLSKWGVVAYGMFGGDHGAARRWLGLNDEPSWNLSGCSWEPPTSLL